MDGMKTMRTNYLVPVPTQLHRELETLLLSYGGSELVCLPEDSDAILRGTLMQSTKIILKLGERNRCHDNAQKLYQEHPNRYRLAYGYALSEDGLWRQHSWLIRKSDNAIMET